jgi:hypothetical protein
MAEQGDVEDKSLSYRHITTCLDIANFYNYTQPIMDYQEIFLKNVIFINTLG